MIRRLTKSLLAIGALGSIVTVAALAAPPMTVHVRDVVANGQAKMVGRLPASQSMRLVLVLPLSNQTAAKNFINDLYNPSSPSFHQFLSVEQFTASSAPARRTTTPWSA